mgnify:CR=1 FL=1
MENIIKPVFDSMRKGNMRVSPRSNFPDDKTFIKFAVGHAMEDNFQTHWNRSGLLIDGNIKIKEDISNGDPRGEMFISGEADGIIRDFETDEEGNITQISSTHAIGMEMKTNRGYFARKEVYGLGNKRYPNGHPKMDHVMQTAMYLMMRWKMEEYYGVLIDSFRIVYCQVDDGLTTFFDISLSDGYEGNVIIKDRYGELVKPDVLASLEAGVNLDPVSGLTTDSIKDRFYAGDMSKTAAAAWEKKPLAEIGDWQCRFCDWGEVCMPFGVLTKAVEEGLLTPEAAMGQLGITAFGK